MLESVGRRLRAYADKDGRGYPDWAVRYVPIVRRLRAGHLSGARILEIGANENGMARFARTRVIAVDIDLAHLEAARANQDVLPVQAHMAALPFRTHSVDICVCVDTFEHVPPEVREPATREIVRVLRRSGKAVVAFPAGDGALRAEETIQMAYRRHAGRSLTWLEEHRVQGLPDPDGVAADFARCTHDTHRVTRSENAPLWLWRWMWRVLMCGWPGWGNALWQAALRVSTPLLCRIHVGTCYRTIIWLEPKPETDPGPLNP